MKHLSIHGIALILGSLGGILTMLFHPTGADLLAQSEHIARRGEMMAVATHSLALASVPLTLFGYLGLSRRLGWDNTAALAALVAYAFSAMSVLCAAVFSGLVAPSLTRQMTTADESTRQVVQSIFHYNGSLNQGFAKVFVVASSVAVILWSVSIMKTGKFALIIAIIGLVVSLASLAAFFAGHLRLNVHGFGLFMLAQALWTILVGVLLIRSSD